MNHKRLNAYRIMWLFVMFDLPVASTEERKAAHQFRKKLLRDGFYMMQFSVYVRHCASFENAKVHINRTEKNIPSKGQVSILTVTDKQFGLIKNFWGKVQKKPKQNSSLQLELF